ncbi:MAG: hypothetical protein ACRDRU_00235 [Pseudonocardiaceae bacterium]
MEGTPAAVHPAAHRTVNAERHRRRRHPVAAGLPFPPNTLAQPASPSAAAPTYRTLITVIAPPAMSSSQPSPRKTALEVLQLPPPERHRPPSGGVPRQTSHQRPRTLHHREQRQPPPSPDP